MNAYKIKNFIQINANKINSAVVLILYFFNEKFKKKDNKFFIIYGTNPKKYNLHDTTKPSFK